MYQNTYKGATNLQELSIAYDAVGNVTQKRDLKRGLLEYFQYDALDRLQWGQVNGQAGVYHSYSSDGNVGYRDDVGGYYYTDSTHPHAVTSAGSCTYQYDAAGRMTNRCGSTLDWTSYDLPAVIRKGTQTATFSYGVDRQRYKQVDSGATNETIYYVGSLFEKHIAGSNTTYRHYVPFRGETRLMVNRLPNATQTMSFLHRDAQGSVSEVTSGSGALVDSFAFDPWGLRRNATTWAALADPFGGTQVTEDGYTGHEHLDPVGLIHMNGRVQDPKLGRFISPDPLVQAPYSSQSLNRYSYAWNNPETLIDPSGFQCITIQGIPIGCGGGGRPGEGPAPPAGYGLGPNVFGQDKDELLAEIRLWNTLERLGDTAVLSPCGPCHPAPPPVDPRFEDITRSVRGAVEGAGNFLADGLEKDAAGLDYFDANLFMPAFGAFPGGALEHVGEITAARGVRFLAGLLRTSNAARGVSYRLGEAVTRIGSYEWATMSPAQRIAAVVEKYGINLRGKAIVYDSSLGTGQLGMTSAANPNVLRVGSGVMNSEQELAATIAHELRHGRAYLGSGSNSEAAAEASEQALREYIQGLR